MYMLQTSEKHINIITKQPEETWENIRFTYQDNQKMIINNDVFHSGDMGLTYITNIIDDSLDPDVIKPIDKDERPNGFEIRLSDINDISEDDFISILLENYKHDRTFIGSNENISHYIMSRSNNIKYMIYESNLLYDNKKYYVGVYISRNIGCYNKPGKMSQKIRANCKTILKIFKIELTDKINKRVLKEKLKT